MMHRQGNGEFPANINFGEHDAESVVGVIDIYINIPSHANKLNMHPKGDKSLYVPTTTCDTKELFKGTISSKV